MDKKNKSVIKEYVEFMSHMEKIEEQLAGLHNANSRVEGVINQHKLVGKTVPNMLTKENDKIKEVKGNFIDSLIKVKLDVNQKFDVNYDELTEDEIEELNKYKNKINLFFNELGLKFGINFK